MKKLFTLFTVLLLTTVLINGCGGIKKMMEQASSVKFDVTPKVLESKGGYVSFSFTGTFPPMYFDKNAEVTLTPVLKYGEKEKAFDAIKFQGEKVAGNAITVEYQNGAQFTYPTAKFEFAEEMRSSKLVLKISASAKGQTMELPSVELASGIICTEFLLLPTNDETNTQTNSATTANTGVSSFILAGFVAQTSAPKSVFADIHFKISSSEMQKTELSADDITALKKFVADNAILTTTTVGTIKLEGYASPDGPYALNEKLAKQRSANTKKMLEKDFKKAKIEKTKSTDLIQEYSTAEDWEGFKAAVLKSDMTEKDLIIRVLSTYTDAAIREQEIKKMSAVYEILKDKILPRLRRTDITIGSVAPPRTNEELIRLATYTPTALNVEELLKAASLIDDMQTKQRVYSSTATSFPNDWRVQNNLAYTYFAQNNNTDAYTTLRLAETLDPGNATILHNLGLICLAQNQQLEAFNYFNTAATAPGQTTAVGTTNSQQITNAALAQMGILNIKQGNYEAAVQNFGDACVFNAALAKVLAKNYSGALVTLSCMTSESAISYYLKAVIGARQENVTFLLENLRTAIAKDNTLKAKAKIDAEFIKYFTDAGFQALVQ